MCVSVHQWVLLQLSSLSSVSRHTALSPHKCHPFSPSFTVSAIRVYSVCERESITCIQRCVSVAASGCTLDALTALTVEEKGEVSHFTHTSGVSVDRVCKKEPLKQAIHAEDEDVICSLPLPEDTGGRVCD